MTSFFLKTKNFRLLIIAFIVSFFEISYFSNYFDASPLIDKNNDQVYKLNTTYLDGYKNNFYIIGKGDRLLINVGVDYPELLSQVLVDGEGTISMPLIKRVYVEGLSLDELNNLLDKAYAKFAKYPSVESEVVFYRPIKILVEGEVNNPGFHILAGSLTKDRPGEFIKTLDDINELNFKYNTQPNITSSLINLKTGVPEFNQKNNKLGNNYSFPTVFDAIQKSEGITDLADLSRIEVIRKEKLSNGGGKKMTSLDFEDFLSYNEESQNIRIYDGDILKVRKLSSPNTKNISKALKSQLNPKYINVYIAGRVRNPGMVTIGKLSTLNDAIDLAGGAKFIRGKIKYMSYNTDGTFEKRKISYRNNRARGSYHNPNLKQGDFIIVGENFLSVASESINEVTSPFRGIVSTYMLLDAISD